MSDTGSSDPRPYHHGDLRRALIEAALALVTEEQDWAFSLREVARRAGVSHNAPYNHFPEKRDLLGAVAAAGFESLRERMRAAVAGVASPAEALLASGKAYVNAGVENPALYRLMFGPALAATNSSPVGVAKLGVHVTKADGGRPAEARAAGAGAKTVLDEIILRGAEFGGFCRFGNERKGSCYRVAIGLVSCPRPYVADDRWAYRFGTVGRYTGDAAHPHALRRTPAALRRFYAESACDTAISASFALARATAARALWRAT